LKVVDLTWRITPEGPVYPGDPAPSFQVLASHERDGYYHRLACHPEHAGTHIDAPAHFDPQGVTIDRVPLDRLVAPGVLVDAKGHNTIPASILDGLDIEGRAILFHTGWRKGQDHPVLDPGLAERLAREKAAIVGLDAPSPDRDPWPVHRILLAAGIPIIEYLCCLDRLAGAREFILVAAPIPYLDGSGAPARVYALIPQAEAP